MKVSGSVERTQLVLDLQLGLCWIKPEGGGGKNANYFLAFFFAFFDFSLFFAFFAFCNFFEREFRSTATLKIPLKTRNQSQISYFLHF